MKVAEIVLMVIAAILAINFLAILVWSLAK